MDFNVLARLFLLAAVLSCLMGIADGRETLGMIATGVVILMVSGRWDMDCDARHCHQYEYA